MNDSGDQQSDKEKAPINRIIGALLSSSFPTFGLGFFVWFLAAKRRDEDSS
jgi:hypothetical protein